MQHLLVIIPTFNEKENIEDIIRAVFSQKYSFDILIIDDNSPDGTAEIVNSLREGEFKDKLFILNREKKLGLGTAYIAGFHWAIEHNYDYVFEMDADFSHNPSDLNALYEACFQQGADIAVGSRYVKGGRVMNWPKGRVLMSYYASIYVRSILWLPVKDTTAGFVCYNIKVLKAFNLDKIKFRGYAFQIEMKYLGWRFGFNIKEVPIIFTDRKRGSSKMNKNIFKEAILGVIEMRLINFFKKYHC